MTPTELEAELTKTRNELCDAKEKWCQYMNKVALLQPWKDALEHHAAMLHLSGDDPKVLLGQIIALENMIALDPKVSSDAEALVREGLNEAIDAAVDICERQSKNHAYGVGTAAAKCGALIAALKLIAPRPVNMFWIEPSPVLPSGSSR